MVPLENRGIGTIIHRRQNGEILAGFEPRNRFIFQEIPFDTISIFPPSEDSAAGRFAAYGEKEEEVGGKSGWREKIEKSITEGKNALWRVIQCLS